MRVVVIGGCGFIGTRLGRRLARNNGIEVSVIDKAPRGEMASRTVMADVRSLSALREAIDRKSLIIHLAAEHRDDVTPRSLYRDVNVGGAENVCAVARERDVATIIFTSSVAVYGTALPGTDEHGAIAPCNDYGRTKYDAELVFRQWQSEQPRARTLVIIRPTVVFGEQNRGNVYNLMRQVAAGRFVMVGGGLNRKSMAYVENVAAFIEHSMACAPGTHVFNYVDEPALTMNELVGEIEKLTGHNRLGSLRLPISLALLLGWAVDRWALITGKKYAVSAVRVKKFCAESVYKSSIAGTGFAAPVPLAMALARTIRHEFVDASSGGEVYYTE